MINTLIRDSIVIKEIKKCMDAALGELFCNNEFLELDHLCKIDTERDLIEFNYYLDYLKTEIESNTLLQEKKTYLFKDPFMMDFESEDSINLKSILYEDSNETLSLEVKIEHIKDNKLCKIKLTKEIKSKEIKLEYIFSDYDENRFNSLIIHLDYFRHIFNAITIEFDKKNKIDVTQHEAEYYYTKEFLNKDKFCSSELDLKDVCNFLNLFRPFVSFNTQGTPTPPEINDIIFNGANIDDSLIDTLSIGYDIDLKDIKKYSDFLIDVKKFNCENIKTTKNIIKVKG